MSAIRELDLRRLPHEMRHGVVFQCFDSLTTGDALVIVNDHDPLPLLQQFKFVRPGQSEYEYLEQGPASWQVRIRRRAPAVQASASPGPDPGARRTGEADTVTDYLQADHRRLDGILADAQRLVAAGAYDDAAARFAEFAAGLDRHIDVEEQILFPTFEGATGMHAGPTQVMRAEHIEIRGHIRAATDALDREDAEEFSASADALTETLSAHNMKEEHMLYPMADQAMHGDAQRRELVSRLQAF